MKKIIYCIGISKFSRAGALRLQYQQLVCSCKAKLCLTYFCVLFFSVTSIVHTETLNDALIESQNFNYKKSLKILKKLPETEQKLKHLAWAHMKVGNHYEASEIFLKLNQNDYEILFGLGLSYFLQEDYETAFLYFDKCLDVNKNCAAAEYFRGEIKGLQDFYDDAVKHL